MERLNLRRDEAPAILLGLSQNLRECPSLNITIFIGHFSRLAEVGAKVEQAVLKASAPAVF